MPAAWGGGNRKGKNMSNEVRHTPGPWKAVLVEGHRLGGRNGAARYDVLAMNPPDFVADRLTEANARLIVRAVNAHADLLAAAKCALAALEGLTSGTDATEDGDETPVGATMRELRAAIAKAEGE